MKVYIVMSICYGELEGIEKVFTTKEAAEKYVLENKNKRSSQFYIDEKEIEED